MFSHDSSCHIPSIDLISPAYVTPNVPYKNKIVKK
ncbi:hypothetical protein BMETH_3658_0 [methanotrophic bacterial endosymbiont of Bathymodiolus sp.]|nr:hypothetical protein BMETH_3658_0 [methanotrophic bacterial endosymbiont of Bathymodiolus sp.]